MRVQTHRLLALLLLSLLVLPLGLRAQAEQSTDQPTVPARVVGVTDGDTLTAIDAYNRQAKIRLHGIDCPESNQDFGTKAKQFTSNLCFGKNVQLRIVDTDRYGRIVAEVILPDGSSLNKKLVEAGMAHWYRQYAPKDRGLELAEAKAQAAKVGVWSMDNPTQPWEFRKSNPQPDAEAPAAGSNERVSEPTQDMTVYVTRTGKKYHRGTCRYLSKSKIPTSLSEAQRRYEPCSVCRP